MELNVRHPVILLFSFYISLFSQTVCAHPPETFEDWEPIQQFIQEMVQEHKFDHAALTELFKHSRKYQSILDAISRPAEAKPWYEYKQIFVNRERVRGGVLFWNDNADIIQKVAKQYRVAPEIMVAIVGVETRYGKHKGQYPVLDSLSTLAFAYPPRSSFFRGELKQYLLMSREEKFDPLDQKGSYAGAMGMPQFISSSFRRYAVDFDGDGKRDLWENTADVLGSVANYFKRHGWMAGQPIAHRVSVSGLKYRSLIDGELKPHYSPEQLRLAGVILPDGVPPDLKGNLIKLDGGDGPEYWAVWNNFYVISRYNHSALYSMAVLQLGSQIAQSR